MSDTIEAWRKSGEYLPPFMRDFHDQKDLFKALYDVVERFNAKAGGTPIRADWISTHVYTIDVFLWVMAKYGYTLQRSRKPFEFPDIADFVARARDERNAAFAKVFPASPTPEQSQ